MGTMTGSPSSRLNLCLGRKYLRGETINCEITLSLNSFVHQLGLRLVPLRLCVIHTVPVPFTCNGVKEDPRQNPVTLPKRRTPLCK